MVFVNDLVFLYESVKQMILRLTCKDSHLFWIMNESEQIGWESD